MKKYIAAAVLAALAIPSAPALADPPPWAPAHGKRAKDRGLYDGSGRYYAAASPVAKRPHLASEGWTLLLPPREWHDRADHRRRRWCARWTRARWRPRPDGRDDHWRGRRWSIGARHRPWRTQMPLN